MIPGSIPAGTYAIRVTRVGDQKLLLFENAKGVRLGSPMNINPGPTALRAAVEPLLGRSFDSIEQEHMIRVGSDVLILVSQKGDEEGVSGRLRKQESSKPIQPRT